MSTWYECDKHTARFSRTRKQHNVSEEWNRDVESGSIEVRNEQS